MSNLGELISRFARIDADAVLMHEDVHAWGAPSECHDDVSRSTDRAWEELEKEVGMDFASLIRKAEKTTGGGFYVRHYSECVSRIVHRDSMFS